MTTNKKQNGENPGAHRVLFQRSIFVSIMTLVLFCLPSCASNECSDGKCIEEYDPDWGASLLVALEPETGEGRWAVNFHRQSLEILGLQDNGKSVVVAGLDPCFEEPKVRAIALSKDGGYVDVLPAASVSPPLDWCADVATDGVAVFKQISGICVGLEGANGDVLAVDPADSTEMWRSKLAASSIHVVDSVLIAMTEVMVGETVQHRALRISAANGSILWMHPGVHPMSALGANNQFVFFLDTRPFAINLGTGELAWEHIEKDWEYVPGQDGGVLLGNTLLLKRQYVPASECGASVTN